jgi:alpha-beta hydrolase superfamily lysophospholipase
MYINDEWLKHGEPENIMFIGHSVGGLLARKVYVAACGSTEDAPFSDWMRTSSWMGIWKLNKLTPPCPIWDIKKPQPWAAHVKRIILLAGMNRGWEISYHFSAKTAILWSIGVWSANIIELVCRRRPLMLHMRRGASFITQLRLQWIAMRNRGKGGALTVQLLGSTDDVVSPEDNVDLISGRDFIYLDVPETGHDDIIHVDPESIEEDGRSGILRDAIKLLPDDLMKRAVSISDQPLAKVDPSVNEVIFVVHGIRDAGYWTQKIARRVIAHARKLDKDNQSPDKPPQRVFAMETASYGYFAMAPFLFASRRRQKVEWLMNQYAEAMANYPCAEFSCVAHSNGTYLVARALKEYAACRFKRIVFAGSVVRQSFDWDQYINSGRVKAVLNYVATKD